MSNYETTDTHIYEEGRFFGCYLLKSLNEKYKGRTYIGFTVNPNRRINQHNSGYHKGGAKRTSGKGPWEMALIVHGFPNEISALRFEWAWQNPEKSIRLKHLITTKAKQYSFQFKFNILCEMLRIGPWCRLPLTIRWLKQEHKLEFPLSKLPPNHMPIEFGLVQIVKKKKSTMPSSSQFDLELNECFLCGDQDNMDNTIHKSLIMLKCIHCNTSYHSICLARYFIKDSEHMLPIDGCCVKCDCYLLWGDLIKYRLDGYKSKKLDVDDLADEPDDDEDDFEEMDDENNENENRELQQLEEY